MQTAVKNFKNWKEGKKEQNKRAELLIGIFIFYQDSYLQTERVTGEKAAENFKK